MEDLLGAIFEVLGEVIIELLFHIIGFFVSFVDYNLETDPKFKRRIKCIITYTFYGLAVLLFVLALFYKKTTMASISLIYLICLSTLNILKVINNNNWNSSAFKIIIVTIRRIIYYTFPIVCIIYGAKTLTNQSAIIWLCVLSGVALFIYLIVDIRRIVKYCKKRNNLMEPLKYWEEIEEFNS